MILPAVLALLRPLNLIGLVAATAAGARLSGGPYFVSAAIVPCFAAAFGYARNDAVDRAADRVNRPGRPVAAGRLSAGSAGRIAWALLAAGAILLVSLRPGGAHVAAYALAAAGLYFYSPWLKTMGALGPLSIALLSGLALWWGGWLGEHPHRVAAASLLAACATFARECAKDLEDLEGDRAAGRETWPVRSGTRPVERALRAGAGLALAAVPLPWVQGDAGGAYLAIAGLVSAPALAWVAFRRGAYDGPSARRASRALKGALFAGILGLFAGARP